HKGVSFLGTEHLDITEIDGADSLYEAHGIIGKSEENAGKLFGCRTYYSTEGSSLCIRAMVYLIMLYARGCGKKPIIAAGRNAHKAFLSAAALLCPEITWLYPKNGGSYLSCMPDERELEELLSNAECAPAAVYITSPDYLGNLADISAIAEICHRHGCLLAVDNAHGAYLKFLEPLAHPIDLGADICCDSAHKTLPVLTGGAYLHISPSAPEQFSRQAKNALALFGSTSPSYLILQSLDLSNVYLTGYRQRLGEFLPRVERLKKELAARDFSLCGNEPLKITVDAKKYGYKGTELARILRENNAECEFSDPDYLVLMLTPENGTDGLERLKNIMTGIPRRAPLTDRPPEIKKGERVLSVREAVMAPSETVPAEESRGRVLAAATVGCPPAVPILVSGERIDDHAVSCFKYYGVNTCEVVCNT
ncbi:MAG: aminotransferase class V-fold PLP-dependent enzyme, partial [Clostridia bacterium]|nr:aminotransferase class V-fold PLP-dependent enzyme [Clostridia bacterium]